MVRKKLKAILALLVAVMFVLQAAPMYSFAEESAKDAGTVTAEQQSEQARKLLTMKMRFFLIMPLMKMAIR